MEPSEHTIASLPAHSLADSPSLDRHGGTFVEDDFGSRYERPRLIGLGGMGRVLCVYDTILERDVALKSLATEPTPAALERFRREATTTAKLNHPGIVTVYDRGWHNGAPFYTMTLLTGGCWRPTDATPLRTQLDRLASACEAVGFANDRSVYHRDLKPPNLMLGEQGELVVVDWGLTRTSRDDDVTDAAVPTATDLTIEGKCLGTPLYMSPEQARGDEADARADVWALGMMLLEVLANEHPFAGLSSRAIIERLARDETPDIESRLAATAPELVAVVRKALAARPSARYSSASGLADDLRRYLDGRRVLAFTYGKRDALRRFYKAFGPTVNIAATATLGLLLVGAWAWYRTAQERDRALVAQRQARAAEQEAVVQKRATDAFSKRVMAQQAREALDRGEVDDAAELARSALALGTSPTARGVLIEAAATPHPRVVRDAPAPCPAARLSSAAQYVLCRDADTLELHDPTGRAAPRVLNDLREGGYVTVDDTREQVVWQGGNTEVRYDLRAALASPIQRLLSVETLPVVRRPLSPPADPPVASCSSGSPSSVEDFDGHVVTVCASGHVLLDGHPVNERPIWINATASLDASTAVLGQDNGNISTLDLRTGALQSWPTPAGRIDAFEVLGRHLVALSAGRGHTVIWDVKHAIERARVPRTWGQLHRVREDGVLVSLGDRLRTWHLPTFDGTTRFDAGHGISDASDDRSTASVAAAVADGSVACWNTESGAVRWRSYWNELSVIKAVAFTPGGHHVLGLAALDGKIRVLRAADGRQVNTLDNKAGGPRLLVLRDGSIWATCYDEGLLRWPNALASEPGTPFNFGKADDASTSEGGVTAIILEKYTGALARVRAGRTDLERLGTVDAVVAADITDDGTRIVVARERTLRLVDEHLNPCSARWETASDIIDVSISGDGEMVAAGLRDGTIELWDTVQGEQLASLHPHRSRVAHVKFASDTLISASWDGTVRRFSLSPLHETFPITP